MKLIKTLAAVAAFAALSTPALANIKAVNAGQSEIFLVVGDQNGSYMLDTGMTLNDVLNTSAGFTRSVASSAWTSYIGSDTNLFDGASNSNTGTRWALFVYDGASESDYSLQQVLTTLGKGLSTANITFDALTMNSAWGATGNLGQQANGTGTHPSQANGASFNPQGTTGYAGVNFFKFGSANVFIGNKVGDSSSLFLIKGDPELFDDPLATVVARNTGLTASFDGQTLSVTTAVPEPESYALMAAGLAAIGFVARRRRA